jgi:hypothetical protein
MSIRMTMLAESIMALLTMLAEFLLPPKGRHIRVAQGRHMRTPVVQAPVVKALPVKAVLSAPVLSSLPMFTPVFTPRREVALVAYVEKALMAKAVLVDDFCVVIAPPVSAWPVFSSCTEAASYRREARNDAR